MSDEPTPPTRKPFKMLISRERLWEKIQADPDSDAEAGAVEADAIRAQIREGYKEISVEAKRRRARMNDQPTSPTLSTRDPLRNGVGAAILTRLRDRMKIDAEFSEPGHASWKRHKARAELLRELIAEFEALS